MFYIVFVIAIIPLQAFATQSFPQRYHPTEKQDQRIPDLNPTSLQKPDSRSIYTADLAGSPRPLPHIAAFQRLHAECCRILRPGS